MENRMSSTALCVAAFIQMVGVGLIVALLPNRVIQLSGSMDYVGYITSAFAVPFVFSQLPAGRFGDRYGYKKFLVGGYIVACLAGWVYFKSNQVWEILAGRALQGLAEVPAWALAPALLSLLFARTKGEAIGKYNASFHLGLTAGSLLSIWAITRWSGNEAFLLYAATGLVGAVLVTLFVKDPKDIGRERENIGYGEVLQAMKQIRRPAVHTGICIYGGGYGAFLTVVPGVLLVEKGFSQSGVAVFFSLFYIAISLAQIIAGRISDRNGPDAPMYAGLLLVAAGLASFMWFSGNLVYVALSLASFGLGMFCISAMVILNGAVPVSLKGSISGVFYLLWGLGYFLVPPILTKAGGAIGYRTVFSVAALVVLGELAALRVQPGTPR
ncbi:MAG: MFS transporter [Synergistales bacterium]